MKSKKTKKRSLICTNRKSLVSQKQKRFPSFYSQPIEYPIYKKPDNAINLNQLNNAKSAKEIVTAIGTFNPLHKNHDFTQTWHQKSNFFTENDYIDKLFHILRGNWERGWAPNNPCHQEAVAGSKSLGARKITHRGLMWNLRPLCPTNHEIIWCCRST